MNAVIEGIYYHFRGIRMAFKEPRLLFWGFVRFVAVLLVTVAVSWLILAHHAEILNAVWSRPESRWVLWLWVVLSWLLSLFLIGVGAVLSYLIAQVLFAVLIMDHMSRITERMLTGCLEESGGGVLRTMLYLVRQEVPRSILPVLISLILMVFGWLFPLGPLWVLLSSGAAVCFLSWDNTDLVPARRMLPFGERFRMFRESLWFHLGFGLPFLIPGLNILLLSFAPVGATMYALQRSQPVSGNLRPG